MLVCSQTHKLPNCNTVQTLNFLAKNGYKVSKKRAQIYFQKFQYLGYRLTLGQGQLSRDQIQADLGPPATKQQLCSFLEMASFCRIWIPNFQLMVKPLYEVVKCPDSVSLDGPE